MNLIAAAAPFAATNPVLGIIGVTVSAISLTAALTSGKKNQPTHAPSLSTQAVVKETEKRAKKVTLSAKKARQTEEKQRQHLDVEIHQARSNTNITTTSTQILRRASASVEAQTEITRDHLQNLEKLQLDLASTQRSLRDTKEKLKEREREMSSLNAKLSMTSIRLEEAVKKNTKTSTEIIQTALSASKTHQDTIEPLLKSKDAEIEKLKHEVSSLRKTLRLINERLTEAQTEHKPIVPPRIGSANSSFYKPTPQAKPGTEEDRTKLGALA